MLLSTAELLVPSTRRRRAWLPRVSVSQGLQACQALSTMVIAGMMVGRSFASGEGAAHELLLFQLLCSFLAPLSSRCLDPDRAAKAHTPALTALTHISDASTLAVVAGVALRSSWPMPAPLVVAAMATFTTATAILHQAALRRLPKTFTEGEAWLCVSLATNGALWLASEAAAATHTPSSSASRGTTALARLLQLDTLPALIALSTTAFCCGAARPLCAAVEQLAASPLGPSHNGPSQRKTKLRTTSGTCSPGADGSISPWPVAPTNGHAAHPPKATPQMQTSAAALPPRRHAPMAQLVAITAAYAAVMCACAAATLQYVFAAPHRAATVALWALALAVTVPCMLLVARTGRVPHHILRKGFHIICLGLFIPVLLTDPPLLSLALAVAYVLLALAELVRTADVPALSAALTGPMTRFTDARDEGAFLVSHLSLLLGIAVPVWVSLACRDSASRLPLTAWSGLVVLGLSDTVAATVGSLLGRVKVHLTSRKTAEGLLAASAVTLASLGIVAVSMGQAGDGVWWLQLAWYSLLACVLEAVTLQLDNLVFAWHAFALLSLLG